MGQKSAQVVLLEGAKKFGNARTRNPSNWVNMRPMAVATKRRLQAALDICALPGNHDVEAGLLGFDGVVFSPSEMHFFDVKCGRASFVTAAHQALTTQVFLDTNLFALFQDEHFRYSQLIAELDVVITEAGLRAIMDVAARTRTPYCSADWTAKFESLPSEVLDRDSASQLLPVGGWVRQIQHLQLLKGRFEKVRRLFLAAAARLLKLLISKETPRQAAFASRCRPFYLTHGAHPPKAQLQHIEKLFTGRTSQPLTAYA